jgi:hypothetical protein
VAILLAYGTVHVLLADDAEAREEEYMVSGSYARPYLCILPANRTVLSVGDAGIEPATSAV